MSVIRDVTLNQREQARLQVLNGVMEFQLPMAQAAELLGGSERQLRRVLAVYQRDRVSALVPRSSAAAVIPASEKYAGFTHSHFTEVLAEREGIRLRHLTVSRLLNRCRHATPSPRMPVEAVAQYYRQG